jgi:hypothetical protein
MGLNRPAHGYNSLAFVAQVLAATATQTDPIFIAPTKCRVTKVSVLPQSPSTGDNTNRKNLNVRNKLQDGSGTTLGAHLNLVTGVNLVAFDETVLPMEVGNPNGIEMADGDVLGLETEKVGTGVTTGPFIVNVEYVPV